MSISGLDDRIHGIGTVPPEGSKDAKIAFIGEAPARDELRLGRPFMGEAGRMFEQALHQAGLIRGQCYITNFSKRPITKAQMTSYYTQKVGLKGKGLTCQEELLEELDEVKANIFVPMGGPAMCALTGLSGTGKSITKRRGYVTSSVELPSRRTVKVLPALHPASCLYGGSFINLYYISHDFVKARNESESPDFSYDPTTLVIPDTFNDACEILHNLIGISPITFDIEVVNYETSCISFATSAEWATSIPLYNCGWSVEEEVELWNLLSCILEDRKTVKIAQNFIFDAHFLATRNGIHVKGDIIDTMIAHHIIYPDMLKGLDFLASIHCNRPYWKDMVSFNNIKKES